MLARSCPRRSDLPVATLYYGAKSNSKRRKPMKAMIFDIDGTLLHSAADDDVIYRAAVREVLGPVRFRDELVDYRHVTDSGILFQVLEDNQIDHTPEIEESVRSIVLDGIKDYIHLNGPFAVLPGAKSLLGQIAMSPNHTLAIATGGWRSVAEYKLSSSGFQIGELPSATSDDSHERVEIMKTALERSASECDTACYFGDAPWDRAACHALGWEFLPVGPVVGCMEDFREFKLR